MQKNLKIWFSPRQWNTGLVSSRVSLTSWGEWAFLALVGHPSSDGILILNKNTLWGRCFITLTSLTPLIVLVKTKSDFIVRLVETGLGRWILVVAVIIVDVYPLLAFSDPTCHLEDTGIGVFWLHCAAW